MIKFCTGYFLIVLIATVLNVTYGQRYTLIPGLGIPEINIRLDSSRIEEAIAQFGNHYRLKHYALLTTYAYDSLGLEFSIDPYDLNKVIREITVRSPAQARTTQGIDLERSTMKDVFKLHAANGCFISGEYAYHSEAGISYYILRTEKEKGYKPDNLLTKIELNTENQFGIRSRVNFTYNTGPIDSFTNTVLRRLRNNKISQAAIDFVRSEAAKNRVTYEVEIENDDYRTIGYGIRQHDFQFSIARRKFFFGILSKDGAELWNKLWSHDTLYYEFVQEREIEVVIDDRENPVQQLSEVFNYNIFGTFCSASGSPPEHCLEMLDLINENEGAKLAAWLNSLNPEISVYGAVGLHFLQMQGSHYMSNEVAQKINILSQQNLLLNCCEGCSYGVQRKPNEILNKRYLRMMYKAFEASGWFR